MKETLKNLFFIAALLFFQSALAQDAAKAITEAGLTVPDAVDKAKEVGYSDQEILKAIEQAKNEGKVPVEQPSVPDEKRIKETLGLSRTFQEIQNAVFESYNIITTPKYRLFALPPFGYEIFNNPPASFEPLDYGPADPNYQIGPGDELAVSLYGDVQYSNTFKVDREGKITIPEAGIIIVNGETLAAASKKIVERLSLVYSGIRSRSISADITLGKLKRIKIFVMGEVRQPGGFTISSTNTAFTALYYAAGPTNQGSLRRVQVLRNNKTIATIDLYDLILKGKKDSDIRLQNGDVVYVPLAPKKVAIPRGVYRPGIYEPLPGEGLKAVLALAGGLRPDAYTDIIQINRTGKDGLVKLIDLPSKEIAGSAAEYDLESEDVIGIYKVPEGVDNIVQINGLVLIPGTYQITDSTTLGDLITKAGGLLKIAYQPRAEVSRILFYARPESTVTFILNLDSEADLSFPLKFRDKVIVRQDPDYHLQKGVTIDGMVHFPGYYSLTAEGERLSSVIKRAGGLKPLAYPEGSIFSRAGAGQIDVNLAKALSNNGSLHDVVMRDGDALSVPEMPSTVNVIGAVRFPVNTLYERGQGYKYYLEKVGGATEEADRKRITVRLPNGRNMKPKTFFGLVQRDIPPGASIIVPRKKESTDINWGDVLQNTAAIISTAVMTIAVIRQYK
ncbi:SLBB domain-containing protein [candidate division TA06 bacterium]|uniref:SLBB domain-containing protein n=1 Tax=candidate division TA06 bacterium TaxID=2250710 RepID=A0A933I7T3_UNCT6|nr:SLBB domain-containing protein [candidate division TA06 bacterium]